MIRGPAAGARQPNMATAATRTAHWQQLAWHPCGLPPTTLKRRGSTTQQYSSRARHTWSGRRPPRWRCRRRPPQPAPAGTERNAATSKACLVLSWQRGRLPPSPGGLQSLWHAAGIPSSASCCGHVLRQLNKQQAPARLLLEDGGGSVADGAGGDAVGPEALLAGQVELLGGGALQPPRCRARQRSVGLLAGAAASEAVMATGCAGLSDLQHLRPPFSIQPSIPPQQVASAASPWPQ